MTISGLNEINKPVLKSSKPGQDISNTTTIKDSVELSSSSNQSQDLAELSRNQNLAEFVRKQVQSQLVNLKFIHINDFHGYVDEYRIPQEDGIVGGITRVGTEIKKLKEENPEGAITLNGGDIFEGGSYTKYTQGEIISKTFQNIGFDATVIGNHDMSWGLEAYADIAKACGGDFLGANVVDYSPEKHLNFLKPYKIIEKQGVKVGIIGLTTHMTSVGPYEKKIVDIESPEITAEKYIKQLKNEDNVDMVVVLSHLGLEKDKELAEKVKGIDVIVGAHCHTALKEPEKVGNTLIVQAGTDGKYVGNLDIVFDREKKNVVSYDGKLIPVTTEIKQDPEVKSIIAPYIEKYKAINNEVINKSEQDLPLVRDKRTALVNLFIDSQKLDSDLSAGSLFCIRKGLNKGDITQGDLFNMYPFESELLQVKTEGKSILRFLEGGLTFFHPEKDNYALVSGLTYEYNPYLVQGNRITSITMKGKRYTRDEFASKILTVSMDDYTYGKSYFRKGELVKKYGSVFDIFKDYIKKNSLLKNIPDDPRCSIVSDVPDKNLVSDLIIGKIDKELVYKQGTFCNASQFFADAIKGKADMSLGYNRTIKAGLPKGKITNASLKKMYPYEDALITAEVTGNRILAFLESAVTDKFKGIDPLLASGITYKYDSSKPEGQRIVSVTIGDKTYNPMELFQARVTVAMDSYLYYAKFSQRSKLKGKRGNIYNCLVDYLDKKPSVRDATPLGTDIHESSFAVGQEEKEQVRKKKLRELLKEMNPTLFNQKFLETL